jgi:hypothetical protein
MEYAITTPARTFGVIPFKKTIHHPRKSVGTFCIVKLVVIGIAHFLLLVFAIIVAMWSQPKLEINSSGSFAPEK